MVHMHSHSVYNVWMSLSENFHVNYIFACDTHTNTHTCAAEVEAPNEKLAGKLDLLIFNTLELRPVCASDFDSDVNSFDKVAE